ncbi:MAG TPA: hypothetical protein VF116_17810 [Ktedonobacterales bacterium]
MTDANFNLHIVAGLRRRIPGVDIVTAQQSGLPTLPDPQLLSSARALDRNLLTHDRKSMPAHFTDHLAHLPADQHSPGVMTVEQTLPVGAAIEAIRLEVMCSGHDEWQDQFVFLPLR